MPEPADPYGFRKIVPPNPRGDAALRGFSCGEAEHENDVNGLVAQLYAWGPKAAADNPTVVVRHEGAATVGVGAYHERPLYPVEDPPPDEAYIWVIGLSEGYRGKGLGVRLLSSVMEHIRDDWGRVPDTWAYVSPTNRHSHPMFEAGGFAWMPSFGGDSIRFRAEAPLD